VQLAKGGLPPFLEMCDYGLHLHAEFDIFADTKAAVARSTKFPVITKGAA
jgi:hypothetical protein